MIKINLIVIILCIVISNISAADTSPDAMTLRINEQLNSDGRDKYDGVKDPGRKPAQTVKFFGVKDGMTVLDVIAGGGYNSEILSAAVGPKGLVYAQNSHYVTTLIGGAHHKAMRGRLKNRRLANVRYLVVDTADMPFVESMDMAFWGFNMHDVYHNDGETATVDFLGHVKRALKPGGILAISEHVGDAGNDNAELHRLETDIMMKILEKAGFVVEETSDLLGNPDDDRTRSVYADGLRYNTDRILIRARKP